MINDNVLQNPLFDGEEPEDYDAFLSTIEQKLIDAGSPYPSFVVLPGDASVATISWSEEAGYTSDVTDGSWDSLEALYDHIDSTIQKNIVLDPSTEDSPQMDSSMGGMHFLKPRRPQDRSARLLTSYENPRPMYVKDYYSWLTIAKAYIEAPEDFYFAYHFLNGHPAFWYLSDRWKGNKDAPYTRSNSWTTNAGIHTFSVNVIGLKNGETTIGMEAGAAVTDSYAHHYHDTELDVYEPTFEKAYVEMAKRVHAKFSLDGSRRDTDIVED